MSTLPIRTPVVWGVILLEETDGMRIIIFLLGAVFLWFFSGKGLAYETHGRVSVNNYYLADNSSVSDYNISTVRLKLKTDNVAGKKSSLILHTRSRFKVGGREYSSEIPNHRINSFYLKLRPLDKKFGVDLGRMYVRDARGVRVDGVNVNYSPSEKNRSGVFAGGEPDPYQDSLNTNFFTFGGYFSHVEKRVGISLSSVTSSFKGKLDRSLVELHGFFKFSGRTRFSHSMTVDYDKINKRAKLTDLNLSLDSSFLRKLRMRIGYNRYQPITRFESMNFRFPSNREDSYTLNLSYRGLQNYLFYSGAGYRYRTFDGRDSIRVFLGLRRRDIFRSGSDLEFKYTYTNHYSFSQQSFFGELSKEFFGRLDLSASVTVRNQEYTFFEINQKRLLYQLNADYMVMKSVFLSVNVEYSDEEEYDSIALFTNLSYKF